MDRRTTNWPATLRVCGWLTIIAWLIFLTTWQGMSDWVAYRYHRTLEDYVLREIIHQLNIPEPQEPSLTY